MKSLTTPTKAWLLFLALTIVTIGIYRPGLTGTFLFDDYPNIVDNPGVKPKDASLASLARVAMSSPSSEFKRPLASLTFGANYLATGMDPYAMKATNLVIHLLNGWLVFLLTRTVLRTLLERRTDTPRDAGDMSAAWIAGLWLCLPINVTAVLYVVQRMESLANLFVLAGLVAYIAVRRQMQVRSGILLIAALTASLIVPTVLGLLAKETAVMLPLYALVIETVLFGGRSLSEPASDKRRIDRAVLALFTLVLALPALIGLAWLLPGLLRPSGWSTRDFTMSTRLLSEARIVLDYLGWTLAPTPGALSFYHDDFVISRGLLTPWTTLASLLGLIGIAGLALATRRRLPLVALGIGLFFACQVLTGTILPLELVYEHRNYFASTGVLLAVVPLFAQPGLFLSERAANAFPVTRIGPVALAGLAVVWIGLTGLTAYSWGDPLRLAYELGQRAPNSPRAQYELGRTYIILSGYRTDSPFLRLSYAPLERAAALPDSGILPEQALIFLNARLKRAVDARWWDSIDTKLRTRKVTVQDESALSSLVECVQNSQCDLPNDRLFSAYQAALSHPRPSGRLLANYGNFAWVCLNDKPLGQRMLQAAVAAKPDEPAYRITLARMAVANEDMDLARAQRQALSRLNIGGSLTSDIEDIDRLTGRH